MNKQQNNFFVITGTPGVGKTSVIKELKKQGVHCEDEPARLIITDQRSMGGEGIPDKNPKLFTELLLKKSISNFIKNAPSYNIVFFDRGIVDCIGYAHLFGLDTSSIFDLSAQYRYNLNVFVLSPWDEIFEKDDERKMTFDESLSFHQMLLEPYRKLGYNLIEVPRGSIIERSQFILNHIKNLK